MAIEGRAKDPRRESFLYRNGRFWELVDKTRRQVVYRRRAWRTQFGEAILEAYNFQLTGSAPVRWDERAVRAEMRARRYPEGRVLRERQRLRLKADGIQILEPSFSSEIGSSEVLPEPSYPRFAQSADERFRWDLCARLVRVDKVPPIDPDAMWHEAIAFYGSDVDSEELWRLWNRVIAAKATTHG